MSGAITLEQCQQMISDCSFHKKEQILRVIQSVSMIIQSGEELDAEKIGVVIDGIEVAIVNLYSEVDRSKDKIGKLEAEVGGLKEEVKKLNEKVKKAVSQQDIILIGQLAYKLDKVLVKKALQDTGVEKKQMDYLTINQLEHVATENGPGKPLSREAKRIFQSELITEKAVKNWDDLYEKLDLETVFDAILSFKESRNYEAHPDINLEDAYRRLHSSTYLTVNDKEMMEKLYKILQDLNVQNIGTHR